MRCGKTITLFLINKLEATTGMMRTRAYIGQQMQLYCSGMGKLFLAYGSADYIPQYWQTKSDIIQKLTVNTITTIDGMQTELETIRRRRAMDNEENELGVSCIACPIFDHQQKVHYAISVSLSTARLISWAGKSTTGYSRNSRKFQLSWGR